MARYRVEFKAFKTGEWYTKTLTDHLGPAQSVALTKNYGRAWRVTDTETGIIYDEGPEQPGAAEMSKKSR